MKTREQIKSELLSVIKLLTQVFLHEYGKKKPNEFNAAALKGFELKELASQAYQNAYTRALPLLRSLLPERMAEFVSCYEPDPKRKEIDSTSYKIKDYLFGLQVSRGGVPLFSPIDPFSGQIQHQISILQALHDTFDDRVSSIEAVLAASIFDREIDTAQELLNKGHLGPRGQSQEFFWRRIWLP